MGWDISTASYASKSYDYSGLLSANAYDMQFLSSKVYLMDYNANVIYQYSITGDDVSTLSYDSKSFDPSSESTEAIGIQFKPDGSKLYVLDNSSCIIYQYSLTGGDISTASYDSKSFDLSSQGTFFRNFVFNSDGTKLYAARDSTTIYQYTLSTPYVIDTASYDSITLDVSGEMSGSREIFIGDSGTKFYVTSADDFGIYQYTLSTPDSFSGASYASKMFIGTQGFGLISISLKSDGTVLYIADFLKTIYQYSVGGGFTPTTGYTVTYAMTGGFGAPNGGFNTYLTPYTYTYILLESGDYVLMENDDHVQRE